MRARVKGLTGTLGLTGRLGVSGAVGWRSHVTDDLPVIAPESNSDHRT
jgi:hypothetical protein